MADTRLEMLTKIAATPGGLNPIQQEEYDKLKSEETSTSPLDLAQQMYDMLEQYKAPAISTLEQSRSTIGDVFDPQRATIEAERSPLNERYDQLLKDITGYTTRATAQEFGKRGIPLSSSIYADALARKIEPQLERVGQQ